jgi:hypothetical protein
MATDNWVIAALSEGEGGVGGVGLKGVAYGFKVEEGRGIVGIS